MESPAKKINLGTSSPDLLATSENKTQGMLLVVVCIVITYSIYLILYSSSV